MNIQQNVNIKDYSTLHVGGQFRYFVVVSSLNDLSLLYAIVQNDGKYENTPIFTLGGGSNIVFSDGVLNIIALKMEIKGFEIINENNEYVDIKVGAGENWDSFVEKTVSMNLVGLESLSLIPGTVGASPVQNIGAYGSEVKDTIIAVEIFDIENGVISNLSNADCKFGYRDSIFKNEAKGQYIIIAVTYRLTKSLPSIPNYPGVIKYFEDREINIPTLKEVRDAIIYIRKEKLPDPKEIPNTGSFFKNPIISKESFLAIGLAYDNEQIPFFNAGKDKMTKQDLVKIPAGWLIENAGLKGKSVGNVSLYNKNALVLVNNGSATCEDILKARDEIVKIVKDKFGITLEQEPEIL
jgi:UDP-N-acetylmuramate dehydrogenase